MLRSQNNIRKDLFYVYDALYTSIKHDGVLFEKLTSKLKHTPEQVRQALGLDDEHTGQNRPEQKIKREERTQNIKDIDMLRTFYYNELKVIFENSLEEEKRTKKLNSISLDEYKRMYSIISSVPITKGTSRKDILDSLRYYFDDEARTASLIKNKY
ncbi:MAG: hypothetical protein FWD47_14190 [Treponema sp.]|nr:hypothetical protein [Treponema sp.]